MTHALISRSALALLTLVLFLARVGQSWAANLYCSPLGSGTKSGADWDNTIAGKPTTLVRGNTYYFASGAYGSWYFAPLAGTSTVTLKKATASDHGTSTGWNASYGTGSATITGVANLVNIAMSYLTIDGQETDGFQFIGTGTIDNGPVRIFNGATADFLTFRYCHLEAVSGRTAVSQMKLFYNLASSYTDHTFEYCTFVNGGQTWITESTGSNLTVQYCTFNTCGSGSSSYHSCGFALSGNNNVIIRYNTLKNMIKNGSTTFIEPQITGNGMYVYGNVFIQDQPWGGCSQGIYAVTASDSFLNAYFYNNTIYGLDSSLPGIYLNSSGTSSAYATNNVWQNCTAAPNFTGNVVHGNNILNTGEVNFTAPASGNFHLSANTSNGTTLSSPYNVDPDGVTRTPGSWSKGAFQYVSSGPGTIMLTTNAISVNETAGTVSVSASRVGSFTGAVGISFSTADGTAIQGVNYTQTIGSLAWTNGESGTKSFSIPIINASTYGFPIFSASLSSPTGGATLGSPSTVNITINGSGSPPVSILPWPATWKATNAQISAPFITNSGYVYQTTTTDVTNGGTMTFTFVAPSAMYAKVEVSVDAPTLYQNSAGFDFNDYNIIYPDKVSQFIPPTVGFETRTIGWQGTNGTDTAPPVKIWYIPAGTNTLVVKGREEMTRFDIVSVIKLVTNTISSVSTSTTNGWYKAGVVIPISVNTPVAATVTGTPLLALNTGTNAIYASGSGTTNLIFNYTVAAGQNVSSLDYVATNSLSLNGGTIKDSGGVDITLTLPSPGSDNSLSFGRLVVIDTTAPVCVIGSPTVNVVRANTIGVSFPVSFSDAYLNYSRLLAADVTLNTTGGVTATKTVSGVDSNWTVSISSISVPTSGSFTITIAAGTAVDNAGNTSIVTGPSSSVSVFTVSGGTLRVISTTNARVIVSSP